MTTSVDVTNRALAQSGTRSQITSMTDGSAEALYANLLYNELRDFMLREGDYDFSLQNAAATGEAAGTAPWAWTYTYPTAALRIRQSIPLTYVALDPQPVEWNELNDAGTRKIASKVKISRFIFTAAPANEDLWDSIFTEAFTRLLSSALIFALENRIEASKMKLEEALSFAGIANLRDG